MPCYKRIPFNFLRKALQASGVAMGSPLGQTIANAFLVHFEKNWLQNCPSDFESYYYRHYVDDIFVLFTSPQHFEAFQNFVDGQYVNVSFAIERAKQNLLP